MSRARASRTGGDADMLHLSSTDSEAGEEFDLDNEAVDLLSAERETSGAQNAVADWSRPGVSTGRDGKRADAADAAGAEGSGGGDALAMEDGMDLFVIDNNPDMSLLRAASPQSGAAAVAEGANDRTEAHGQAAHDTSASATTAASAAAPRADAAANSTSSSANAQVGQAASTTTAAQTQHLAGPGEHVLTQGLLLPSNIILEGEDMQSRGGAGGGGPGEGEEGEDLGEYEQLDATRTAARYYEEEKEEQRKAKELCHKCGEQGHQARKCPHIKCLKCGAVDEHPTRSCPLALQCFRCGQVGHMSRDCKNKAAPGSSARECERCGSQSHRAATCPTLWRIYVYNSAAEYADARQKKHDALQLELVETGGDINLNKTASSSGTGKKGKENEKRKGKEADKDADLGKPRRDWDPATRWCYSCGMKGNHWGDDCPTPRSAQTHYNSFNRTTEPGIFSERVSRLGPFAHELEQAPPVAGPGGLPPSSFDFEIGPGASMHLSADPSSFRADRAGTSYGYNNLPRRGEPARDLLDRFDRRAGGRDRDRDRDRDRGRDRYDDRDRDRSGRRDRYNDDLDYDRYDSRRSGRGSDRRWEGRAGGYDQEEEDPDDWFAGRAERSSKRSKNANASSSTHERTSQRRRDREDEDESGTGSGAKRSRNGPSLMDRIAGSDNNRSSKSSTQQGGSGGRAGRGYRDDDEDANGNGREKGKGRQAAGGDPLSPSRTLGASEVISLISEDEDDAAPRHGRSQGGGRRGRDDDESSDNQDFDDDSDDDDDDDFEVDESRSSIQTGGSYASIGRAHLGGPAYGPGHGGAGESWRGRGRGRGQGRGRGGRGGGHSTRGRGAGGFPPVGAYSDEKPKKRKRNKGAEGGEGSVSGGGGGGGGRRKRKVKQGSAAPSSSGGHRESSVKSEGGGSQKAKGKPNRGGKGNKKNKSSGNGGEGKSKGGVKKEGSSVPSVKREFKPQFRGGY